ncbi:hypothetical protein [Nocardia sp. alder85J]|uniref:hypothetical protein n=1 Tax=Nocardia sp. alder85J TaxID=2862949 RepID=UPI001CD5B9B8|nr:hypothetical protein [Nocardia sp. alder85J]MCX4091408.1 hypothetical protein [Nocardia sp. alder85J]
MRITTFAVTTAVAAGVVGTLGAGTAAAVGPAPEPPVPGWVGVELSPQETAALAASPIPGLVDQAAPNDTVGLCPDPQSRLTWTGPLGWLPAQRMSGTIADAVTEAAAHPGGRVIIYVSAPTAEIPDVLHFYQRWSF